jgi:hypothetical protein
MAEQPDAPDTAEEQKLNREARRALKRGKTAGNETRGRRETQRDFRKTARTRSDRATSGGRPKK